MYLASFTSIGVGFYTLIVRKFVFKNGIVIIGNYAVAIGAAAILIGFYVLYYAIKGYSGDKSRRKNRNSIKI